MDLCVEEDGDEAPARTFYQLQIPIGPFERTDRFKKDAPYLHGLNCFMPDELVPDTKAYQESQRMVDEILKELDAFSSLLPHTESAPANEQIQEGKE